MDLVVFLPLLIILGAFMFFASRRQKKAMQATIDLHESLAVGDRVHTTSGLQGTIAASPMTRSTWRSRPACHHLDEAGRAGPHRVRRRLDDDDYDDDDTDIDDSTRTSTATELTGRPGPVKD